MSGLNSIEVNDPDEVIHHESQFDTQGRGAKIYKDKLRGYVDVVMPDGKIKKGIKKYKSKK